MGLIDIYLGPGFVGGVVLSSPSIVRQQKNAKNLTLVQKCYTSFR